jgi:hypothetical protein
MPNSSATSHTEWVLDSGASYHVIDDLHNLSSFYNYEGNDTLQIGNDIRLQITHIGSITLSLSSSSLFLTNILHVPHFTKNLISIF